jgi:hypothetical protein
MRSPGSICRGIGFYSSTQPRDIGAIARSVKIDRRQIAKNDIFIMLTLLDLIQQKLPQASESVLEQVWTILTSADNNAKLLALSNEEEELAAQFERWEAASDEDEVQIEKILTTQQGK